MQKKNVKFIIYQCFKDTNFKSYFFSGVLHNLFDGLTDKDETVRLAIQSALVKIFETHPLRATDILIEYKEKHPKMTEQTTNIILKYVMKSNS